MGTATLLFAVKNDWLDANRAFWILLAALSLLLLGALFLWVQTFSLSRQWDPSEKQEGSLSGKPNKNDNLLDAVKAHPMGVVDQLLQQVRTQAGEKR
ncbi:MAG: hypothetical protein HQL88_11010 [Magnetococcales bacterium]|nr:hypothetical protein [Magnetococcales bacterium]